MRKTFSINNVGEITFYTGCSFRRDESNGTVSIILEACIQKLLENFNATATSEVPARPPVDLISREKEQDPCQEGYREAVESLIWISQMARSDTTNEAREVAQYA